MAKKMRIPGMSFSWKRAVGITGAKQRLARATGIPTTKQGRQRKLGQYASCGGCSTLLLGLLLLSALLILAAVG